MSDFLLDNPLVLSMLFYPRRAQPHSSRLPETYDGSIPAAVEGVTLGYRLYKHPKCADAAVILFFHGNGEVAADYDDLAPLFHESGASLLVVDYRGYGWSTGKPLGSALLLDAEAVMKSLPEMLKPIMGADGERATPLRLGESPLQNTRLFVMGRSLGSAPAIHLAHTFPERFNGLILDSAFAHLPSLLASIGVPLALVQNIHDPIGNTQKIATVRIPTLIIHGERDTLIPIEHGQRLYDNSPAADKVLLRVPRAGHNDILQHGIQAYFSAVKMMVEGN